MPDLDESHDAAPEAADAGRLRDAAMRWLGVSDA